MLYCTYEVRQNNMKWMIDELNYFAQGPIYKYMCTKWAKVTLKEKTFKFTNPDNFNDPFDCNMAILKFSRTEESIRDYEEALNGHNLSRTEKRELLNKFKNSYPEFKKVYTHVVKEKINASGVTCFSKLYNNTLMWSHYADHHKGVCLEFNASLDPREVLEDVEVDMIANVNYNRTDKINYNADKKTAIIDLFTRKSTDWRYEKEVRIVLINKKEVLKFNKKFLTGIILGCRIDKAEKRSILKIIHEMDYDITIIEAIKADFGLEFRTINHRQ